MLTIFAVIFLCGLACGGAAMNFYFHHIMVEPVLIPSVSHLEDELHMTPAQRQTITEELDEYAKYYQNIEQQRESVAEHGKRNILRVLSPEQQKRFQQIFQFPSAPPCTTGSAQTGQ